MRNDPCIWPEASDRLSGNLCLALADVPPAKQELAVEVAGLDRVQVDLAQAARLISPGRLEPALLASSPYTYQLDVLEASEHQRL